MPFQFPAAEYTRADSCIMPINVANGSCDASDTTADYSVPQGHIHFPPAIQIQANGAYDAPRSVVHSSVHQVGTNMWTPPSSRLSATGFPYGWGVQSPTYPQASSADYLQAIYHELSQRLPQDLSFRGDFLSPIPSIAYTQPETPDTHSYNTTISSLSVYRGDSRPSATRSQSPQDCLSPQEQLQLFKQARTLDFPGAGPFIPQPMYKPHTNSDRLRYVERAALEEPIYFITGEIHYGIPLVDALQSRVKHLQNKDELLFDGRGPSISIRLEWPGYRQWSRQIPTRDFKTPPGPINKAKLAKNVAKCVQRFIEENKNSKIEEDSDACWAVETMPGSITLEDLILVSMHHVSMGSWQPQLRLRRPISM